MGLVEMADPLLFTLALPKRRCLLNNSCLHWLMLDYLLGPIYAALVAYGACNMLMLARPEGRSSVFRHATVLTACVSLA